MIAALPHVRAMVRANFRRLAGERRLPFFVLLLPILIMVLVGTIFGTGGKKLPIGVVSDGSGQLGRDLVSALRSSPLLKVRDMHDVGNARSDVRRGRLTAAVVVPDGYDGQVRAGAPGAIRVITQPGRSESAEARVAISIAAARQGIEVAAAHFAVRERDVSFGDALGRAQRVTRSVPLSLGGEAQPESPFSYTAPSNLVLFAFITALIGSAAFVSSQRLGVTRRLLAAPVAAGTVIAAETVSAFFVALLQASVMLAIGALLFGVDWGSPVAVVSLLLATAGCAAGLGLILATLVRTPEQAIAIGPPLGIVLGMLGGCMWPLEGVGPLMRSIGHVAPHAWAMDGFIDTIFGDAGLGGVAAELGVLLAFAVVLLGLATARLRRAVLAA